jgi:hypothetical protein
MDTEHYEITHRHQRFVHSHPRLSLYLIPVSGIQCVQVSGYDSSYKDPRW